MRRLELTDSELELIQYATSFLVTHRKLGENELDVSIDAKELDALENKVYAVPHEGEGV